MNWKLKASIQNAVSLLPSRLSYDAYYFIQRYFGNLRKQNPASRLQAGIGIVDRIYKQNQSIVSKTFLEVGTGHSLNLPIALWLSGASKVITVDLNPYLKPELVFEDITYIRNNLHKIMVLFGTYVELPFFQERLNQLISWNGYSITDLLGAMNISYLAPGRCYTAKYSNSCDRLSYFL